MNRYDSKGIYQKDDLLGQLKEGRRGHACAVFKERTNNRTVVMVAGGYTSASVELLVIGDNWLKPIPWIKGK